MTTIPTKTVDVGGRRFFLQAVVVGDSLLASCRAAEDKDFPWAAALSTAMGRPASLFGQIRAKGGEGWEGAVAYGYHDGDDDPPQGYVICHYLDDASLVLEADFEALAREVARFALEAQPQLGVLAKDASAIRAFLAVSDGKQ